MAIWATNSIPTAIATMSQRRSHSRGRRPKLRRSSRGCGEEKAAAKHMKPRPCYDARRRSTTSALAFPLYALLGLKTWADPVAVLGRRTPEPRLLAMRAVPDSRSIVEMYQWKLPNAAMVPTSAAGIDCARANSNPRRRLNACAQVPVERDPLDRSCTENLNRTWLARPPVVLPPRHPKSCRRSPVRSPGHRQPNPAEARKNERRSVDRPSKKQVRLEHLLLALQPDGKCVALSGGELRTKFDVDIRPFHAVPSAPSAVARRALERAWRKDTTHALQNLRATPVLTAALNGNSRFVILPIWTAGKPPEPVPLP